MLSVKCVLGATGRNVTKTLQRRILLPSVSTLLAPIVEYYERKLRHTGAVTQPLEEKVEMKGSISGKTFRAVSLATQKGAFSWLTVLAIRDMSLDLKK